MTASPLRAAACLLAAWMSLAPVGGRADDAAAAATGSARMAWRLVRASGEGDAILSPASVWEALAMTHAGARGETAAEIAKVLEMPDDREAIASAAASLRRLLAEAKGQKIKLDVANRIWVQRGLKLEASFTGLLEAKYAAAAGLVDFASRPEDARVEINAWVGDHTAGKIPELLPRSAVTPLTRLVLTNAIYLKAPWATPFEPSDSRPDAFTLADGGRAEVPFMHRLGKLVAGRVAYGEAAATLCEIPYEGERLAMVLVVPDRADGLPAVLAGLDGDWRGKANAAGGPRRREVSLAVPKWTARKSLSLNAALAAMGMERAFVAGQADLSGIDGTRDLFVSAVVHEGFVEVSEEGTEAAAATGVVVGVTSVQIPEEPFEVKADRPFAWAVVERSTGAVLFAGTVTDPR